MRFCQMSKSMHPSYLVKGPGGEEEYYIYNNWDYKNNRLIGFELFKVNGCYQKMGTVNGNGNGNGEFIPCENYKCSRSRNTVREIEECLDFCRKQLIATYMGQEEKKVV